MSLVPEWERFTLTYTVQPSFWTEEYAVRLELEGGRFTLTTRNAPGVAREGYPKPKSQTRLKHVLPLEEAGRVLELMEKVRLSVSPPVDLGPTDSDFYRLELKRGALELGLGWYHELPKGWGGLRQLQECLETYAAAFGKPPEPEAEA